MEVPLQSIKDGIDDIGQSVTDGIEYLFVPGQDNILSNTFDSMYENVNNKFPIIQQLRTVIDTLLNEEYIESQAPSFKINLYGSEMSIIDFSMFESIKGWVHQIILAFAWGLFVFRFYKRLPGIIGGFGGYDK